MSEKTIRNSKKRTQYKRRKPTRFKSVLLILILCMIGAAYGILMIKSDLNRSKAKIEALKLEEENAAKLAKELKDREYVESIKANEPATQPDPEKDPVNKYDLKLSASVGELVYYNQTDPRWGDYLYGPSDPISTHGCGPTVMASVVASLTDKKITPTGMSDWAYDNGYCAVGNGSSHALIPEAAAAFGLTVEPLYYPDSKQLIDVIGSGKLIVELTGHGIFSPEDGHFIIIRDVTSDGKLLVSDSVSLDHVYMEWDPQVLLDQASPVSSNGGPFWAISR